MENPRCPSALSGRHAPSENSATPRSIKGIHPPRPPAAFINEPEALPQNDQLVSHQVRGQVAQDQSVYKIRLGSPPVPIVLHLFDLIDQPLPGEFLVHR